MLDKMPNVLLHGNVHANTNDRLSFRQYVRLAASFGLQRSHHVLMLLDGMFLVALYLLAPTSQYGTDRHIIGICFLLVLWMFLAYSSRLYNYLLIENAEKVIRRLLKHHLNFIFAALLFYALLFSNTYKYGSYYLNLLFLGTASFAARIIFLSIRKKYKHTIVKSRNIAIIGSNACSAMLEQHVSDNVTDYNIKSRVAAEGFNITPAEGRRSDIEMMSLSGINEIYCCMSSFSQDALQQLLAEANKYLIRVKFLPEIPSAFGVPVRLESMGAVPVLTVRPEPLLFEGNRIRKRIFDIIFSSLVIVGVLSWLMPLVWIIMRLESRGPLLFRQKRSGIDNRPFTCLKFRSMVAGNATADKKQATKNDARITRVGAFLRKTSIDELPQFFNVLMGNMSVVGPRPHMLAHTDQYREEVETYMIRHFVKPGITGLAQVRGYRGETKELQAMRKRVECDITYIENWSFLLDMKIIFQTVWNVAKGEENAY